MLDFILFYLGVGVVVNWAVVIFLIFVAEVENEDDVAIDYGHAIATVPVWPYTVFTLISGLLDRRNEG